MFRRGGLARIGAGIGLAAWLGGMLLAAPAAAETFPVATGPDYVPFADPKLPRGGLTTELVTAVFTEMGHQVKVNWYPWKRCEDETRQGRQLATFPYIRTPERERDFLYSEDLFAVREQLWVRSDANLDVAEVGDLAGKKLCQPAGYAPPAALRAMIEAKRLWRDEASDMEACFNLLKMRRVDVIATNEMNGRTMNDKVLGGTGRPALVLATNGHHLIIGRAHQRGAAIMAEFNAALLRLKADGRYAEVVRRHLGWAPAP